MCGAPLTPKAAQATPVSAPAVPARGDAPSPATRASVSEPRSSQSPAPETAGVVAAQRDLRPQRPTSNRAVMDEPIISGPSFLGLNQPARSANADRQYESDQYRSSDSGARDGRERYSSDLSYLLEDEEEEKAEAKRGWGKAIAIVVALALLGGFGYLRWKQGGFDWLMKDNKAQSAAATPDSNVPASSVSGSSVSGSSNDGAAASSSAASNPPSPTAPNPSDTNSSAGNSSPTNAAASPDNAATAAPVSTPPPASSDAGSAPPNSAAADNSSTKPDTSNPTPEADEENAEAAATPSDVKPSTITSRATKIEAAQPKKIREPKPTPAAVADPTAQAESYIYGRGVTQDCDRGLQLLKPAAAHANVKAMIVLGSLYSSGTCTPRDLPTSYRWFALALHQQPDSQTLQDDLQSVWAKMTQPERQLAIKLSQ